MAKKHKTVRNRVLIVSDLHIPYEHPDALKFLTALKKLYTPDLVVFTGDEVDNHAISFHNSDPDLHSPGDELTESIKRLKHYYKLFPEAVILESNHGSLVYRKALANGLSKRFLKSYNEILQAPKGWAWHFDYTFNTPIGEVYCHHSKGANALKNSQAIGRSYISGHHHESFSIQYWGHSDALMFGMIAGCLVDTKSLALAYNKNNLKRPVIGCAVVLEGVPILVPMLLDSKGRWTGKL